MIVGVKEKYRGGLPAVRELADVVVFLKNEVRLRGKVSTTGRRQILIADPADNSNRDVVEALLPWKTISRRTSPSDCGFRCCFSSSCSQKRLLQPSALNLLNQVSPVTTAPFGPIHLPVKWISPMPGSTATAEPFYPIHVEPAPQPLRFPFNLSKLLTNNLSIIPAQAYSEPLVIAAGPPRMAFITGSELVKTLLFDRPTGFPKGALQVNTLKPIFGNAMISQEGHEWRWQRGVAAPLFRHDELVHFGATMSAAARAAVTKWQAAAPDTVHAIHKDMMRAAFGVITGTMLAGGAGDMFDAIERGHADYYRGINWWIIYTLLHLPHWLPRPGGKAMRAHEERLRSTVTDLVRRRRVTAANDDDLLAR
ncbi:MAG: cytochrome P450, partial [Gemmataceae bacterium]